MALVTLAALTAVIYPLPTAASTPPTPELSSPPTRPPIARVQNDRITEQNAQLESTNADLEVARAEAVRERDESAAVTAFLVHGFRSPDPARDGRTITIAEILDRAVEDLGERDDLSPTTRATILNAVGESYGGWAS